MLDQLFVNLSQTIQDVLAPYLPEALQNLVAALIPIVGILLLGPLVMMYLTWLERKLVARIQNRIGPNRVGIFGLLQPMADGIKMLTKEDIVPANADRLMHFLSPAIIVAPAMVAWAVLPFGRGMIAADLDLGILFFMAIGAIATICIFMAGWASNNKYSLLGAMRGVAQLVSYEVPMVMSVIVVVMMAGSFSTQAIVDAQAGGWFILTPWGLVGFLIFFLAGAAETNRTPFDLAEAESEIVAGFHTEYSGMKFALFFMAEYLNVFAICAMTSTLFLGGWQGPSILPSWLWFFIKTYALISVLMWFRGTLPRLRIDQLMGLAWKVMLPFALVNIVIAGLWYFIENPVMKWVIGVALVVITFILVVWAHGPGIARKREYQLVD
jgi:NADH-quinone oxidoreductase subunit H